MCVFKPALRRQERCLRLVLLHPGRSSAGSGWKLKSVQARREGAEEINYIETIFQEIYLICQKEEGVEGEGK